MKIIFLDFDGVITTQKSHYKLDREKLDLLGKILDATDAKLVISSSWRKWWSLEETIKDMNTISYFKPFPFPYTYLIVGVTENLRTSNKHVPRGEEIKKWLEDNKGKWSNYVILDDDIDMLDEQQEYFVNTDPLDGLSEEDVNKAIEILNK